MNDEKLNIENDYETDPDITPDRMIIKDDLLTKLKLEKQMSPLNEVPLVEKPGVAFGVEQTKDVLDFSIALTNSIIAALKDGKITVADIPVFFAPLIKLPAALSGLDQVPYELNDLTTAELDELKEFVQTKLDVTDEKAKLIINKSISLLYEIYDLIKIIK